MLNRVRQQSLNRARQNSRIGAVFTEWLDDNTPMDEDHRTEWLDDNTPMDEDHRLMAVISAAQVKELRLRTNAGMMDCKKALTESGGDLDTAGEWLRKKGLAAAAKKAGRVAKEGVVAIARDGEQAALVEINSETDFVARNEAFQAFVTRIAALALHAENLDELLATGLSEGGDVAAALTALIATVGENLTIRRCARIKATQGICATYIHGALADGMGRIGAAVTLECEIADSNHDALAAYGKRLAMHIAAASPLFLSHEDADPDAIATERRILRTQAEESGRPAEVIEKMVEGRLRKYFETNALLEQVYVVDDERKIAKLVEDIGTELGANVRIGAFHRLALGETVSDEASG